MEHRKKELYAEKIPMHKLASYVKAAELVTDKNTIRKVLPIAEEAYRLAKKEDKKNAFLCVLANALPQEKQNAFLNLLLRNAKVERIETDVVLISNLIKQMNTLTALDKNENKESIKIYSQKLLDDEISTAALIAKIAIIEENANEIDPQKILYFYSPIAEVINTAIGKKLRSEAISRIWLPFTTELGKKLNDLQNVIEKTKANITKFCGREVSTRKKDVSSAVLKIKEKGYLNDLLGCRVILKDAKSAIDTAHGLMYRLKQNGIKVEMEDYYSEPKKSGYMAVNMNFVLNDLPVEVQVVDSKTAIKNERIAPHGLHKSYGAVDIKVKEKLINYLD